MNKDIHLTLINDKERLHIWEAGNGLASLLEKGLIDFQNSVLID